MANVWMKHCIATMSVAVKWFIALRALHSFRLVEAQFSKVIKATSVIYLSYFTWKTTQGT